MVAVGNHEIECDDQIGMPFIAYEARFYMLSLSAEVSIMKHRVV